MNIVPSNMTVADYCDAMKRREIIVNPTYQRSDKVWPDAAKSYLIESIILGFPLPKFSLYQITDVRSKKTVKEIVDGQQRSRAIFDFFEDHLVLSRSLETEELKGNKYSDLGEELQQKFVSSSLAVDIFVSASREDVVEVFRRMNSYTIPLNPEEHRHASFQGNFKWFVNRVSKKFENLFLQTGLFNENQLVRMADTKWLSEICDALLSGIRTTSKAILDRLYKERDREFTDEADLDARITDALDHLAAWNEIRNTPLVKPYVAYSLILAITHVLHPADRLQPVFESQGLRTLHNAALRNLSALSEALQNPDGYVEFREFVAACTERTNVRDQRETRFRWMCRALTSDAL